MSLYEELLTAGQHLNEQERSALYKFLLKSEKGRIAAKANEIIRNGEGSEKIANGQIFYSIVDRKISYSACKAGSSHIYEDIRSSNLGFIQSLKVKTVMKFIAQAEVEAIWNFPLPGVNSMEASGYGIVSYPYSDLRYYSNGRSRVIGLIKKMQAKIRKFSTN